jgi:hypothetical protein
VEEQGTLLDSCFYCALLHPEFKNRNCPKCGSTPRFKPARMMSPDTAKEAFADLVARGTDAARLLEFVHIHGVRVLEGSGRTLDDLRRAYEAP